MRSFPTFKKRCQRYCITIHITSDMQSRNAVTAKRKDTNLSFWMIQQVLFLVSRLPRPRHRARTLGIFGHLPVSFFGYSRVPGMKERTFLYPRMMDQGLSGKGMFRHNSFNNGWYMRYVKSKFGTFIIHFVQISFSPSTFHISPSKQLSSPRLSEHQSALVLKTSLLGLNTRQYVLVWL